jgi:predicted deacylase
MEPLCINGVEIKPGSRTTIDLPVGKLYTHASMSMPVHVIHGRKPGPRIFVSAAIHGDEINGVEIIRRLLKMPTLKRIHGSLIAVPIVNVHGFIHHSRYLPDRRDLNRSFPGYEKGSLAARLANIFMREIVNNCTHGIDIHTGASHRSNLPQIRANMDDEKTAKLAHAFGVPVILSSSLRDGSLREAAAEQGIPMLLYEAGEALRFDEVAIRAGVRGILSVMRTLEMLPPSRRKSKRKTTAVVARSTNWVRAPDSGILRPIVSLGSRVEKDSLLGIVSDPFGERETLISAIYDGIVIGRTNLPLVNEGDALFHVARFRGVEKAAERIEEFQVEHLPEPDEEASPDGPIV